MRNLCPQSRWEKYLGFVGYHVYATPAFAILANYEAGPYGTWRWCAVPIALGLYHMLLIGLALISMYKIDE